MKITNIYTVQSIQGRNHEATKRSQTHATKIHRHNKLKCFVIVIQFFFTDCSQPSILLLEIILKLSSSHQQLTTFTYFLFAHSMLVLFGLFGCQKYYLSSWVYIFPKQNQAQSYNPQPTVFLQTYPGLTPRAEHLYCCSGMHEYAPTAHPLDNVSMNLTRQLSLSVKVYWYHVFAYH